MTRFFMKPLVVEGRGQGYLRTLCDHAHLNPVRARLLTAEQSLREHPWGRYRDYLKAPRQRVPWLRVDRLLGDTGIGRD